MYDDDVYIVGDYDEEDYDYAQISSMTAEDRDEEYYDADGNDHALVDDYDEPEIDPDENLCDSEYGENLPD